MSVHQLFLQEYYISRHQFLHVPFGRNIEQIQLKLTKALIQSPKLPHNVLSLLVKNRQVSFQRVQTKTSSLTLTYIFLHFPSLQQSYETALKQLLMLFPLVASIWSHILLQTTPVKLIFYLYFAIWTAYYKNKIRNLTRTMSKIKL